MNPEVRLAWIHDSLAASGIPALIMGGHAVRFYGVERTTIDYDLHLVGVDWSRLSEVIERVLSASPGSIPEAPSWRPDDFRRFIIGRLPDGREERLELWRRNHLLAPFDQLLARRCEGLYGGKMLSFLGLDDLIRSKETEREEDWLDIELLEEIQDEKLRAGARDHQGLATVLGSLRSRKGFECAMRDCLYEVPGLVVDAWNRAKNPMARAYLSPFLPAEMEASMLQPASMIEELILGKLRQVPGGSSRHLALAEVIRRLHKRAAWRSTAGTRSGIDLPVPDAVPGDRAASHPCTCHLLAQVRRRLRDIESGDGPMFSKVALRKVR